MIQMAVLSDILLQYKKSFDKKLWPNERYKWEAVKWFQDHWNLDTDDFPAMLKDSLSKTDNLLASANRYPAGMIVHFASMDPVRVKGMFIKLFDEREDFWERMEEFKLEAKKLLKEDPSKPQRDYQDENAISTYLWLRYPDKYYIYKFGIAEETAKILDQNVIFKQGRYAENIRTHQKFYDEICSVLKKDPKLRQLLDQHLTDTCYPDPELHTMTVDVCHYIAKYLADDKYEWWPKDYAPGISVEEWKELLLDPDVFDENGLKIVRSFLDCGGEASCSLLAQKYGETSNYYKGGSSALARKVIKKTGCESLEEGNENARYWPVLYLGRYAKPEEQGSYIWKLRDELREALQQMEPVKIKAQEEPAAYGKEEFLQEVYMKDTDYDRLKAVLLRKKNIILQGPPGVGKTFAARRLAYSIMGKKDDDRVEFVQFHQNYSYEDFVMGYKPVENGFKLKYGVFYKFCQKAAAHPDQDYFFIIDEINRGNLSKIFGELLMLIENGYRGQEATLAYTGEAFAVPERLHLIGMMNTADRSLAMMDYALRRRFSFFKMKPGFDSAGFLKYRETLNNETFKNLITAVENLNNKITEDVSLGSEFCIGHSYFCGAEICTTDWMHDIVDYDLIPMLEEYCFDDRKKLQDWENILLGVFQ